MPKVFRKINFSKAPDHTIKYLEDKGLEVGFNYTDIKKEAHHKAFTVAKITKLDLLSDIQKSLVDSLKEGKSFDKWKKELTPNLIQKGWYGKQEVINPNTGEIKEIYIGSRRLRTIYHTNTRMAYAQGSANNIYNSFNEYIQYKSLWYGNRRLEHKELHNIVKHKNDKFWATFYPPNGFGCECYVISLSKKDLERLELSVDTRDYTGHIENDFTYDVRYLSSESLENIYYTKALNFTSPNIVKDALDDISSINRSNKFRNFIDEVTKDKSYYQNITIAGSLDFATIGFLKNLGNEPKSVHVSMRKSDLIHLTRESKKSPLSLEEIKDIPIYLQNPNQILYDTKDPAILYIFNNNDKINKIVVRVNYKYKTDIFNFITTATKVNSIDIQKDIDSGVFKIIK